MRNKNFNKNFTKGKIRFAYFIITTACAATAYFIGINRANQTSTESAKTETVKTESTNPVIPAGYVNVNAQSFNERYIDTNAIESVYETKDGFEVIANGEVFSFDCKKGNQANTETTISLSECIPLDDIVGYFTDENGYICLELADVTHQLDNPSNASYDELLEEKGEE